MRHIRVGGVQLGPIQKAETRADVVERLLVMLDQAKAADCELVMYPELALTTFFPRHYMTDQDEVDRWFEREMPNEATLPLFRKAKEYEIAFSIGYAELTADGRHFNTQILVDQKGKLVGKYRKVHLPGHAEFDPERSFQHLEKRYFEPGDLGFPVWRVAGSWGSALMGMMVCNDRRWPESWRVMGLRGVELVMLGYNTPTANAQSADEPVSKRLFHNKLVVQAGAYQNSCWAVSVAKGGDEDGYPLIAGSLIVNPDGEVVAQAEGEDDELLVQVCDLDAARFGKETVFNFAEHRRVEHYGLIASQTGVVEPAE